MVVAAAALATVALGFAVLAWLLGAGVAPAPAAKSPFGMGLREAAPAPGGLSGYILAVQAEFYRSLTAALAAIKRDGAAVWTLAGIGFLYGAFHAAGPGHGKAVVASYLVATKRTLARGLALSLAAALLQATVAVALVWVLATLLSATAASISAAARAVETLSFLALIALGGALLWRKAGRLVGLADDVSHRPAHHHHHAGHESHDHACDVCGHAHAPPAEAVARLAGWRESAAVIVAAGARPCSGAIILLVFAASQGLFAAGVAATFAMALGTALTTGALAALAVLAKRTALALAGGRGRRGAVAVASLEVLAAAFVAVLGAALLAGSWSGAGPV